MLSDKFCVTICLQMPTRLSFVIFLKCKYIIKSQHNFKISCGNWSLESVPFQQIPVAKVVAVT